METIINHNCPADVREDFEEDGYEEYVDKFMDGTLTSSDIKEITERLITSCECGATLRIEITKDPIDPTTLNNENTYQRLGWTDPDAFKDYYKTTSFTCDENGYGFALYKYGCYFILTSGFQA